MAPRKGKQAKEVPKPKVSKKGVQKKTSTKKAGKQAAPVAKADPQELGPDANPPGIVIEAWALKLEQLLKEGSDGVEVSINPVKPRRGYFEVRNGDSGEQYVSLPSMPRPFPPLKALDIDELAKEILVKLKDGETAAAAS